MFDVTCCVMGLALPDAYNFQRTAEKGSLCLRLLQILVFQPKETMKLLYKLQVLS